jgi:hypothetical protein
MSQRQHEQRLLDLIRQQRDQECQALLERARNEAAELLRSAHRRARRQVHQTVLGERARAEARIRSAQAELDTERRRHLQRLGLALLTLARERLPALLAARWADGVSRRDWIRAALTAAIQRLPPQAWLIRHPPDLAPEEIRELLAGLADALTWDPVLEPDPSLGAGLVISCEGMGLDASAAGLLADQSGVEARLLALLALETQP